MNVVDLFKIALLVIVTSTGFGGVIIGIVKFCSNIIADRLAKKYDLKLQKEIETYKELLMKSNYVSKVRFDLEISIYKELCTSLFEMKESVLLLFPLIDSMPEDKDKQKSIWIERYQNATKDYNHYCELISGNASFIPEDLYWAFEEIQKLCLEQINWFRISEKGINGQTKNISIDDEKKLYERNDEINDKRKKIIIKLRNYLSNLEIIEK